MRTTLMAGLCVLVALNGCGGGSTSTPSGPTGGGGGPAAGTGTLTVTESEPMDAGAGVEIDKALTVTFSGAVDERTFTQANVRLLIAPISMRDMQHSDGDPSMDTMAMVMGDVTYDPAAQQLTFAPMAHLQHAQDYHFVLSGIKDVAGTATLATTTIRFRTLNNPSIQRVNYDEATGQVTETEVYTRDADGITTRTEVYKGVKQAGTPLDNYTIFAGAKLPGPPEVAVRSINYNGADNAIKRYSANISQGATVVARGSYIAPGADAKWNQTDDLLTAFSEARVSHGDMHWLTSRFSANDKAGAPWSARTTGFKLSRVELREFDEAGQTRRLVIYTSLGANGVVDVDAGGELTVVDDVVRSYELIERNSMGMRVKTTDFGGGQTPPNPGPDGKLFTADDVPLAVEVSTINAGGHRTLQVDYDGPGPDGNWDTVNDNTVEDYDLFSYAAGTDNLTERRRFGVGANKIMETNGRGDDKLKRVTTYDPNV